MPYRTKTHKPIRVKTPTHNHSPSRWGVGRGGRPWQHLREQVFRRDKYLCQIHLKKGKIKPVALHGDNAGVCDHVTPVAEGGNDDIDNLQTICKDCDRAKTAAEAARGCVRAR